MAQTSVYGVRETLAELKQLDKAAFFEAIKEIKRAARPMQAAMQAGIPHDPPLSGMARGRLAWSGRAKVDVKYGGRKDRRKDEWPLLKLSLNDGAAVVFDMAGKVTRSPFTEQLSSRHGGPSRAMWRPDDQIKREANEAVKDAIARAMKMVNANLVERS